MLPKCLLQAELYQQASVAVKTLQQNVQNTIIPAEIYVLTFFAVMHMQQSNIRILMNEWMLENRVPHNPAEGKLLWSLILSWSHHVSYIQRYLTDACRQEQQNLSAAKRDNHLLTPWLYLRCHERKSWTLTLLQWASVSTICTAPTKPNNEYSALT